MDRRHFLRGLAGVAVGSAAFNRMAFAQPETALTVKKLASDKIVLGPKKIELSRMAMGTGSTGWAGSSNQTRKLGLKGLADLFHEARDNGVNFWDGADMYGSHPHMKEALKGVGRDKVAILTKSTAKTKAEMNADIDRFLKEIGTDHIDILLLHCVTDKDWNVKLRGCMDAIEEAQQKGKVRTRGVSCHTFDALKTAAAEPWVEVDLARINPATVAMDAPPEEVIPVLKQMKQQGKGVIGMKILGNGKLRNRKDECVKYALSLDCIDCFTIGFENPDEFRDMTGTIKTISEQAKTA